MSDVLTCSTATRCKCKESLWSLAQADSGRISKIAQAQVLMSGSATWLRKTNLHSGVAGPRLAADHQSQRTPPQGSSAVCDLLRSNRGQGVGSYLQLRFGHGVATATGARERILQVMIDVQDPESTVQCEVEAKTAHSDLCNRFQAVDQLVRKIIHASEFGGISAL
jgi:hypothetical protein